MAVEAALLRVPVDPIALYHANDECLLFVDTVIDRVAEAWERAGGGTS